MGGPYTSPQRRNSSSAHSPLKRTSQTVGSKSHLFRPPLSLLSTSLNPQDSFAPVKAAASQSAFDAPGSRKRPRPDSRASHYETPRKEDSRPWDGASSTISQTYSAGIASPIPFVSTQYAYAGGLDTPSQAADAQFDDLRGVTPNFHFRRRWSESRRRTREDTDNFATGLDGNYDDQPTVLRSIPSGAAKEQEGWGKFVFNLATVAATKVYSFCTSAAAAPFKGFYAGGGRGYDVPTPQETGEKGMDGSSIWEEINTNYHLRTRTPVPCHFPMDFPFPTMTDRESSPERDAGVPLRPAKRLQTDSGWVMIDRSGSPTRASSPRLSVAPTPSRTVSQSRIPRLAPNQNQQTPLTSRKSLIPVSRRASGISQQGSPARQASYASPRRQTSYFGAKSTVNGGGKPESPMSAEARRYADRIQREEWENDESMRKLNAQLAEMIKEGQEALSRKPEVNESALGASSFGGQHRGLW